MKKKVLKIAALVFAIALICRSHRYLREHLGKRGRLHGYDTQ